MSDPTFKLLSYQIPHFTNLLNIITNKSRGLDASDTGTGKTYCAAALCKVLNLRPIVLCPKSVLPDWSRVLKEFDVNSLGIGNYESYHNCKYYPRGDLKIKNNCEYMRVLKVSKNHPCATERDESFAWERLPENAIFIFDEVHRCKNLRTINSVLLYSAAESKAKILMLSATAADKPETFQLLGFVLGLYPSIRHAKNWISNLVNMELVYYIVKYFPLMLQE